MAVTILTYELFDSLNNKEKADYLLLLKNESKRLDSFLKHSENRIKQNEDVNLRYITIGISFFAMFLSLNTIVQDRFFTIALFGFLTVVLFITGIYNIWQVFSNKRKILFDSLDKLSKMYHQVNSIYEIVEALLFQEKILKNKSLTQKQKQDLLNIQSKLILDYKTTFSEDLN